MKHINRMQLATPITVEDILNIPSHELARTWPAEMTIMMRMTSKSIREVIDKAKLPATVSIIWPKYRNNILKINILFKLLNITTLKLKCFDFDSDKDVEIEVPEVLIIVDHKLKYEYKLLILSDMIYNNERLTLLDLRHSELENYSFNFFKEAFPKLQNLSNLILDGNDFLWSLEFIELLMLLPKLICLNLNSNPNINKKGNVYSGNIQLLHGKILHLEELSLNACNIACGTYDFFKFIEICPKLKRLNLAENAFNEEWIKILSQTLKQCPNLAYLDIRDNYINTEGIERIEGIEGIEEIKGATYITELFKSHDFVSLEFSSKFFRDCKSN